MRAAPCTIRLVHALLTCLKEEHPQEAPVHTLSETRASYLFAIALLRVPRILSTMYQWLCSRSVFPMQACLKVCARRAGLPLRMIVSDLVSKASLGGKVGVGGKVAAGAIAAGSSVRVLPSGALATVKALEVQNTGRAVAAVGDAVDVGLSGVEADAVHIGSCLCHPDFPVHCSRRVRVRDRNPLVSVLFVLITPHDSCALRLGTV